MSFDTAHKEAEDNGLQSDENNETPENTPKGRMGGEGNQWGLQGVCYCRDCNEHCLVHHRVRKGSAGQWREGWGVYSGGI